MITDKGKRICDKEIRAKSEAAIGPLLKWKGCGKPAIVSVPSKHSAGMELDYCRRHLPTQALRNKLK